jgi:DNA-binding transcriptional LysR family regulator
MDRLLSMRVFQTVVDQGGFAAAARSLDMAPAGVTRLVGDLESHLGTRLLQRTTRHVVLTDAGEAYLAKLRLILSDIDEAHAQVLASTAAMSGVLRIAAPPVLAVHVLSPLLAEFAARYPQVVLDVHVDATGSASVEDFDLTLIGSDGPIDGQFVARKLIATEGFLCASPLYLQRSGIPREPLDLARHRCLRMKGANNAAMQWRLIDPATRESCVVPITPALMVNHVDTLMRATLEGAGIGSYPADILAPYLASGRLTRVLAPWITGYPTVHAALPTRKYVPSRTRVFLDFLVERTSQGIKA